MLVQAFLEDSADRFPDQVALICDGQRLTYAEIEARANRWANALRAHGLRRGDRVALYQPNSVEVVLGIFAALKAGGVFVVINPTVKQERLTAILRHCGARALITSGRQAGLVRPLQQAAGSLATVILTSPPSESEVPHLSAAEIEAVYSPARPPRLGIDLDLACLIYTSGSTGDAKGVMSDHSNVVFAAGAITEYLQNRQDDIIINVLPLSFDYGLYQLLMAFKIGGTLVLEKGFAFPALVLRRIAEERVTGLPGVPTLFSLLLQMDLSPYDLSSLRYITNTAAALPASHINQIRTKFPGATLYSMYGLTETKRTLYLPPSQLDTRPDSVGIAIPGTEVWLEDEQGNRLGPGQTGELVVRGRHVMRGYWADPAATAERYRPGPLPGERVCYTGDLFRMDAEGYLYFVARKDDIIKTGGEKVAPKEVEAVLYSLPGVVEAAVIGIPDPLLGQAIKAFIVTKGPALSKASVLAHCRANLEDLKIPRSIEFCSELPKTSSGKIKKTDLH